MTGHVSKDANYLFLYNAFSRLEGTAEGDAKVSAEEIAAIDHRIGQLIQEEPRKEWGLRKLRTDLNLYLNTPLAERNISLLTQLNKIYSKKYPDNLSTMPDDLQRRIGTSLAGKDPISVKETAKSIKEIELGAKETALKECQGFFSPEKIKELESQSYAEISSELDYKKNRNLNLLAHLAANQNPRQREILKTLLAFTEDTTSPFYRENPEDIQGKKEYMNAFRTFFDQQFGGKLSQCQDLQLYKSSMSAIPPEISFCTHLKSLSLVAYNTISEEVLNLTSLETLRFDGDIQEIPKEIDKLRNLKKLEIHCNTLRLPDSIFSLPHLQNLSIHANEKGSLTIPESIRDFKGNLTIEVVWDSLTPESQKLLDSHPENITVVKIK